MIRVTTHNGVDEYEAEHISLTENGDLILGDGKGTNSLGREMIEPLYVFAKGSWLTVKVVAE